MTNTSIKLYAKTHLNETIIKNAGKYAEVDANVLIRGEFGVGKSLLASYIHNVSKRKEESFLTVNCAAISEDILEYDLFGYRGSPFTATFLNGKKGSLYLADKGTLFLEAIDELPLRLQAKLLHVLETKHVIPPEGGEYSAVNVRIIASTNTDLYSMTQSGQFYESLYYHLNVLDIEIPSLKHRKDDIIPLVHNYLNRFNFKYKDNVIISNECLEILEKYEWPWNIRQLENIIEKLVIMCSQREILSEDVLQIIQLDKHNNIYIGDFNKLMDMYEKKIIQEAYSLYKTTRKVAEALNLSQTKSFKIDS